MAIKFRCTHCSQFLGISEFQAGGVVDCPTCGRSVRVPELDGTRAPILDPQLNMEDSTLAQALDELAGIGDEPPESTDTTANRQQIPAKPEIIAPAPLPDPVPIEPPVSAKSAVTIDPNSRQAGQTAAESQPAAKIDTHGELAALAATTSPAEPVSRTTPRTERKGWQYFRTNVLIMSAVTVVVFIAGYLIGSSRSSSADPDAPHANGAAADDANGGSAASSGNVALRGSITYTNESGDSRPDRGARVIVFPREKQGTAKLSVVGFRPGDADADYRIALAALRAQGGDVAVVDDEGGFEISLSVAGRYDILVLSRYQTREEDKQAESGLKMLLTSYFDRPEQLLGQVDFHFSPVRYKGEKPEVWVHSF